LLLAAIGMGLMFMSDTETGINNNYRDSQRAYFAARAGLEEARVRLMPGGDLNGAGNALGLPSTTAANVIYLLNPRGGEAVAPWNAAASNTYFDTQLCQENFNGFPTGTAGIPCAAVPTGTAWYQLANTTSADATLWAGAVGRDTASAMHYKWVRISRKPNRSSAPFKVNTALGDNEEVCWNGTNQAVLPAGSLNSTGTGPGTCDDPPLTFPKMKPVWLLTSLAVIRSRRPMLPWHQKTTFRSRASSTSAAGTTAAACAQTPTATRTSTITNAPPGPARRLPAPASTPCIRTRSSPSQAPRVTPIRR
jgi:hypothetical protein